MIDDFNSTHVSLKKKGSGWQSYIIISCKSQFSTCWHFVDIISCITSSYFYAYLATFGFDSIDYSGTIVVYIYESVFVVSMIKHFLTDFEPDG